MGLFFLPPSHLVDFFHARAKRAASAARGAEPMKKILLLTAFDTRSFALVCSVLGSRWCVVAVLSLAGFPLCFPYSPNIADWTTAVLVLLTTTNY